MARTTSDRVARIIDYIRKHGPVCTNKIAEHFGEPTSGIFVTLKTHVDNGTLVACIVERPGQRKQYEYRIAAAAGGVQPAPFVPIKTASVGRASARHQPDDAHHEPDALATQPGGEPVDPKHDHAAASPSPSIPSPASRERGRGEGDEVQFAIWSTGHLVIRDGDDCLQYPPDVVRRLRAFLACWQFEEQSASTGSGLTASTGSGLT